MSSTTLNSILSNNKEKAGKDGYALNNIKKRLKAYYSTNHSFDIFSQPGIGTVVSITVKKILS